MHLFIDKVSFKTERNVLTICKLRKTIKRHKPISENVFFFSVFDDVF